MADPSLLRDDPERTAEFMARIERGDMIESTDWMPLEYRNLLIKLIQMHAISEIMGAYPEKEWVPRAPNLQRKLSLMAKVQDEMGHGQLLLRIAEDLAAPLGRSREDLIEDLFTGRVKFHNVFHMPAPTWGDCGVIGWLVDGAAIITQGALLDCSYAPYARVLKRICAEESFHMQHGESIILALADGTPEQREMLQGAINRWWNATLIFFGPKEVTPAAAAMMKYRIRHKSNEELRQKYLHRYLPRIFSMGFTVPDPTIRLNPETNEWEYQCNFDELKAIARMEGPLSKERLALRQRSYEMGRWAREVLTARSAAPSLVG